MSTDTQPDKTNTQSTHTPDSLATQTQPALFGRPRWQITLAVIFFAQLMTTTGFSIVFPFLPLYVEDLGSTLNLSVELLAGLVISSQAITMALTAPLWGVVADRYGRKLMVMRAMFGGSILLFLMALVRSAEELILLRAIQGAITGTVAANNAMVASVTPRKHIGFAMGTIQVGLWAGLAVGPIIGGLLADSFGFAMPFIVTAVLLFIAGVLVYFGVDEQFEPQQKRADQPKMNVIAQWRNVLAAEGVGLVYLMRFLSGIGRTMIIPIAPLFVVSLLPADAEAQNIYAGLVISVSSATSTFSGVYLGRLGDRIGHRQILIACAIAAFILYVPQVFVSDVVQLLLLQGLAGFAMGGIISAPSALLAQYTKVGEEGVAYGFDNSIVAGARAVAPMIGSAVALLFGLRGTFGATALLFVLVAIAAYYYLPKVKYNQMQALAAAD